MTDVRVKVRVDTSQVKQSERMLEKAKGRMKRTRDRAATRLGIPTSVKAMSTAAGFRMVSRFRRVGVNNVDPWSEAGAAINAKAQQGADGLIGRSFKADQRAREDTATRFAFVADKEERQALSRDYFKFANSMRQAEEGGRNIVRTAVAGPGMVELIETATEGYLKLIDQAEAWFMGEMEIGK